MTESPRAQGFYQPAEWAPHQAVWLAWPSHEELWQESLAPAQAEFRALCEALSGGEELHILVPDQRRQQDAARALANVRAHFHEVPFGDIWLRDTAPVFLQTRAGARATVRFAFNGWGQKYQLPFDDQVSTRVADLAALPSFHVPWVLEGGSVDVDGDGTCLTTEQCLLNPNRNPTFNRTQLEQGLMETLGVEKIVWLRDGLLNDHTDGHIDTIARFVAPGVVVCMQAQTADDPNREVLEQIASDLARARDARGRLLQVVRIPSPGLICDEDGEVMPASYVNFYIGNHTVVVPTYGSHFDQVACESLRPLFPGRTVVGCSARAILSGGGAFHCITQQVPK